MAINILIYILYLLNAFIILSGAIINGRSKRLLINCNTKWLVLYPAQPILDY